jgi:hypothetical protein
MRRTNRRVLGHDLALAGSDDPVLETTNDPIPVADAAARSADFNATAQSASSLLGQLLQEQRIHRPLQADVQVRDVALSKRDDVDASEGEALEKAGRVLLIAAEAIERFGMTMSNFFWSASRIIAWKPGRMIVAPETAWSENSAAMCQPWRRANSRHTRN